MRAGKLANSRGNIMGNGALSLKEESRVKIFLGDETNLCDEGIIYGVSTEQSGCCWKVYVQSLLKSPYRLFEFERYDGKNLLCGWRLVYGDPLTNRRVYDRKKVYRFEPVS